MVVAVAFYSRSLNRSALNLSSVEKEATAIAEAVRKWSHLLTGRRFRLTTHQRSVGYMCDSNNRGKIKNGKNLRWRLELMQCNCEISYKAGKCNTVPDTLSRVYCSSLSSSTLHDIHAALCHSGVAQMYHYVKANNRPYSSEEVRRIIASCKICAEVKPQFHKPTEMHLIEATQPMERLRIDFKGPLPSAGRSKYMLTVVDEYSRFPFGFPCRSMESQTFVSCLSQPIGLFGYCGCIHSDRGASFMSNEFVSP